MVNVESLVLLDRFLLLSKSKRLTVAQKMAEDAEKIFC